MVITLKTVRTALRKLILRHNYEGFGGKPKGNNTSPLLGSNMPLYVYKCEYCGFEDEVIQQMGSNGLTCSKCGENMTKKPTHQAFVRMKGNPSFRRRYLGTAPYTTRTLSSEKVKGGPGSPLPVAKIEGEKWLESLE